MRRVIYLAWFACGWNARAIWIYGLDRDWPGMTFGIILSVMCVALALWLVKQEESS